ncbi:MAG: N-acetylglucosamine-6-phosphate deacetylase [Chloroflexota bacterium]|nr:N-acetylglucosamine-6-phosphate deacetylase [Chloroflexota bacterium]
MKPKPMILIQNATILTPHRQIAGGAVLIEGPRILAVGRTGQATPSSDTRVIDAGGLWLVPGFIDLQFNGGFGHDFTADPESIWSVAERLPRFGVTSFLPTIISSPLDRISLGQEVVLRQPPGDFAGAIPLGLHIEGPFLNRQKKGAHNPVYLQPPDLKVVQDWMPSTGVRLVSLAPELPGALEMIEVLASHDVLVSAAHSMASYGETMAAIDAGLRYGTHLFNAMPPLGHRAPGLPGALLTDPRPVVGLIADGIHTHPAMISLVWQILGSRRLNLVTDAMAALGMPAGKHLLGDFDVTVDQISARLADGTLAGSILSLDQALRNLIEIAGCSLSEALPTVTETPARALKIESDRGQIAAGYVADLVLLSPELEVSTTIVEGQIVYEKI